MKIFTIWLFLWFIIYNFSPFFQNVFEAGKGVDNLEIPLRSEDVRHRASQDRCPPAGQQHQDPEEYQINESGSGKNCEGSGGAIGQWGDHPHSTLALHGPQNANSGSSE